MDATDMIANPTTPRTIDSSRSGLGRGLPTRRARPAAGYSMIEVLVSLVVLLLGLLGLIGLQARAHNAELESYQRAQALMLLQDMADRMNANRKDSYELAYDAAAVGGDGALADCSGKTGAALDLCEWGNQLKGTAEVAASGACTSASSASCVGAMIGARGCIVYDPATELTTTSGAGLPGTGVYTVSVAWQGFTPVGTAPASLSCGSGAYGSDSRRRIVSATIRIAALGAT
jgi:type IV pilus assembly protein PilV